MPVTLANLKVRPDTLLEINHARIDMGMTQAEIVDLMLRRFKSGDYQGPPPEPSAISTANHSESLPPATEREARMVAGLLKLLRDPNALTGWAGTIETLLTEWMSVATPAAKTTKKKTA